MSLKRWTSREVNGGVGEDEGREGLRPGEEEERDKMKAMEGKVCVCVCVCVCVWERESD